MVKHALAVVEVAIVSSLTLVIHCGDTPYAAREVPRSASIGWRTSLNWPTFRGIEATTVPTGIGTSEQTALGAEFAACLTHPQAKDCQLKYPGLTQEYEENTL